MVKILILRAPGTNCDEETARALRELGAHVEIVHINKFLKNMITIFDYHGIIFPGGFSYGDWIRAGAIWAGKIKTYAMKSLIEYVNNGWPVLGICNGFQVLVELGLLPGWSDNLG
ncbi:MAG: phosphoribosylformylglycinamidine synthase subunit PurQ, partial [Thermoprotei archaeon]